MKYILHSCIFVLVFTSSLSLSWQISQIHIHPQFTSGIQPSHDVALLKMEKEIIFSHEVYPACVHREEFPAQKIAAVSKIAMIVEANDNNIKISDLCHNC